MRRLAEEVIAQLERGVPLAEIARSRIRPAERELLQRCAVVLSFDQPLVDEVLREGVAGGDREAVPFELLTRREFAERLPRSHGRYQLRESVRRDYLRAWWEAGDGGRPLPSDQVPDGLRRLSERLVAYYEGLKEAGDLDRLYHLVAVDRAAARNLFVELYRDADKKFDRARCNDLINLLNARRELLGPELKALLDSYALYFKARGLWVGEYYHSAHYFERESLTNSFESLLGHGTQWVLHLNAPCGMGKTMFVRWLIARRCVPEPARLPCALIDFEDSPRNDPVRFTREPWTFTLRLAEQLNEQIEGGPFKNLISDLRDRALCAPPLQSGAQSSLDGFERFANDLVDAKLGRHVVIVFDSLEAATARRAADVAALVDRLAALHKRFPLLRLILSGRDHLGHLAEKVPGFAQRYGPVAATVNLGPFRPDEAHGYLERRLRHRNTHFDGPVADAVVEKAGGHPFKLAAYADLIEAYPTVTPREIAETEDPDLALLIRKVVDRISDRGARWLLRYGVVLRGLSLPVVKAVLGPHLRRTHDGKTEHDDPNTGLPPRLRDDTRYEMPADEWASGEIDLDAAWEALSQHTGSSWLSTGDAPGTLAFSPEVLRAMRKALQPSGVFTRLHRSAADYFKNQADEGGARWCRPAREAVYHSFQAEGPAAAAYWQSLLEGARAEADPECRLELAREVTGTDYLDENEQPLSWFGGGKIVDDAILARAYFECALARSDIATSSTVPGPRADLWKKVRQDYDRAQPFMQKQSAPVIHPARVALLECRLTAAEGGEAEALALVADALAAGPEPRDLLRLQVERGDLLSRLARYEEAAEAYEAARAAAASAPAVAPRFAVELAKKSSANHMRLGDYDRAARDLERALEEARSRLDGPAELELRRHLAEAHHRAGSFMQALRLTEVEGPAEDAEKSPEELVEHFRLRLLRGRIYLSLRDPLRALEECSEAFGLESGLDSDAVARAFSIAEVLQLSALARELRGTVLGELAEYHTALDQLNAARDRFTEAGDADGAFRCFTQMIWTQLRLVGNTREAAVLLDQAAELVGRNEDENSLRLQLLKADWLYRSTDQRDQSREIIARLIERSQRERWPPRMVVIVALEALAQYGPQPLENYQSPLLEALVKLRPATARVNFPKLLRRCPSLSEVSEELREAVEQLLPRADDVDSPAVALNLAEVYRVLGREQRAEAMLPQVLRDFSAHGTVFPLLQALHTLTMMKGSESAPALAAEWLGKFLSDYGEYHTLCAVAHIHLAQFYLRTDNHGACEYHLDCATNRLHARREQFLTRWDAVVEVLRYELAEKRGEDERVAGHYRWRAHQRLQTLLGDTLFAREISKQKLGSPIDFHEEEADASPGRAESDEVFRRNTEEGAVAAILRAREAAYVAQLSEEPDQTLAVNTISSLGERKLPPGAKFDALAAHTDPHRDEPFSQPFLKRFLDDYRRVAAELGARVLSKNAWLLDGSPELRARDLDVRLEVQGEPLEALPWEFMTPPGGDAPPLSVSDSVRFFYRALPGTTPEPGDANFPELADTVWVQRALQRLMGSRAEGLRDDGNYGPVTVRLVKEFQREQDLCIDGIAGPLTLKWLKRRLYELEGKGGPRVLLLRAGRESDALDAERAPGEDPADLYRESGVSVTLLEDPSVEQFARELRRQAPDIIHMCGTMKLSLSLGAHLDFAGRAPKEPLGEGAEGPAVFSIPALSNQLKLLCGRGELRPVLVFDVLRPSGISETLRQYFIRNVFASEFFRLGLASAIIGTGLGDGDEQSRLYRAFAQGVTEWRSVGYVVRKMRGGGEAWAPAGAVTSGGPEDQRRLARLIPSVGTLLLTQNPFH